MASINPHEDETTGRFDSGEPTEPKPSATPSRFELSAVVVGYDDRPDRCTIFPTEATRLQRMARWITADADAFVSLDERR
ncbi:DUF7511 domain-containing protein [Haladaptatus salinisoli]|uniref:DUF7511 domain-containing protein n=1 Tax=Haladaptatus salinisoli TaxID=2884876 RepID=UPI001D0BC944|nr:hypothetical protein [Haladaptatus salinisoli]